MFVSFSKALRRMGGLRLGVGLRVTKRNAWYMLFVVFIVSMAIAMWYMTIGTGWLLYWMLFGLYKIYYYMFKGCAWAVKKLYRFITRKIEARKLDMAADSNISE